MKNNYTFFYKSSSPFSNWYMGKFIHNGVEYNCGEQYMMKAKADLFNDDEVGNIIMEQTTPRKQKMLGREVRNFDPIVWDNKCIDIMVEGLISKFEQNEYCMNRLLETGDTMMVEASPTDRIWGIGLSEEDPSVLDETKWRGKNYLGIVLMKVRDELKKRV